MSEKILKDIANLNSLERGILVLFAVLFFPAAAHRAMIVSLGSTVYIYILNFFVISSAISYPIFRDDKDLSIAIAIFFIVACIFYIIIY